MKKRISIVLAIPVALSISLLHFNPEKKTNHTVDTASYVQQAIALK